MGVTRFLNHALHVKSGFICWEIHLQTSCTVWETFSWSEQDLSYSLFTPQGHTSQLIPVTRKLQRPPLWQTWALRTSVTTASGNDIGFSCLCSCLRVRHLGELKFLKLKARLKIGVKRKLEFIAWCAHAQWAKCIYQLTKQQTNKHLRRPDTFKSHFSKHAFSFLFEASFRSLISLVWFIWQVSRGLLPN